MADFHEWRAIKKKIFIQLSELLLFLPEYQHVIRAQPIKCIDLA